MKTKIPENNRPRIKLKRTTLDWVLEAVAISFLLILIVLPLIWGKAFMPVFLLLTFGVVVIYIVRSLNNRQSEYKEAGSIAFSCCFF